MASNPVFFELSWSILSTIGMGNVFFGFLVVNVTNLSPIAAVPLVTSTACAVANGLCFYAFYLTEEPVTNRAVASGFADISWLIQEAGMSLYSYVILSRILRDRQWYIFAGLFWTAMVAITVVRINIAITRIRFIVGGHAELQRTVNYLHMAYFPLIAIVECISAYYLLTTFARAKMATFRRASKTSLFQYLMRSTEVRLAMLAVVGIMRAVTYSFQDAAQSATNLATQVDRFCYTMECLFPIVMYIDMLSSKVVYSNQLHQQHCNVSLSLHNSQRSKTLRRETSGGGNGGKAVHVSYPSSSRVERVIHVSAGPARDVDDDDVEDAPAAAPGRTNSQERIVASEAFGMEESDVAMGPMGNGVRWAGVNRTVEFGVAVGSPEEHREVEPRTIPV